jgi:hypothetical protein
MEDAGMGRWIGAVVVVFGLCAGGAHAGSGDERGRSGMRAHVDPQTGRFVPEPVTPPPHRLPALPAPVAKEVPAPGGGMMAVLNGQFMSDLVATVEPDGKLRMRCVTREPHAPARP